MRFLIDQSFSLQGANSASCSSVVDQYFSRTFRYRPPLTLQVSKLYACQKGRVKIQVCKDFGTVRVNEVERMLSIMTKFRNVCAHNDRLFDFRTQDALLDMSIHKRLQIPRKAGRYCFGKEDLFAQVIILKIFLQEEDFALFYTELKQCFGKHPIYETVLLLTSHKNPTLAQLCLKFREENTFQTA